MGELNDDCWQIKDILAYSGVPQDTIDQCEQVIAHSLQPNISIFTIIDRTFFLLSQDQFTAAIPFMQAYLASIGFAVSPPTSVPTFPFKIAEVCFVALVG